MTSYSYYSFMLSWMNDFEVSQPGIAHIVWVCILNHESVLHGGGIIFPHHWGLQQEHLHKSKEPNGHWIAVASYNYIKLLDLCFDCQKQSFFFFAEHWIHGLSWEICSSHIYTIYLISHWSDFFVSQCYDITIHFVFKPSAMRLWCSFSIVVMHQILAAWINPPWQWVNGSTLIACNVFYEYFLALYSCWYHC